MMANDQGNRRAPARPVDRLVGLEVDMESVLFKAELTFVTAGRSCANFRSRRIIAQGTSQNTVDVASRISARLEAWHVGVPVEPAMYADVSLVGTMIDRLAGIRGRTWLPNDQGNRRAPARPVDRLVGLEVEMESV